MKKLLLLFAFFLPLFLCAQLDKIRPGMSIAEFRQQFPGAVHDYGAMTSYVYANESQASVKGVATYTLSHDTVSSYWFQSQRVDGPCENYPAADSSECTRLLTAARILAGHYTDLYGDPREKNTQSLLHPGGAANEVNVFYSKWKTANDELIVVVHRPGKTAEISAANAYVKANAKEENSCSYVLEVITTGKGRELRSEFGNGYSIEEFKKWQPSLASQIKIFPDCWSVADETTAKNGKWLFRFSNEELASFSFELYDGVNYGRATEQAYAALRERVMQLNSEANAQFGAADSSSAVMPEKYKAQKSLKNYYSLTNYYSRWKKDGKIIELEMNEDGGGKQGEPVFRLEVHCEKQ